MKHLNDRTPQALGVSATAAPASAPRVEDERLVQAMHEYLAALEAGQKPDRAAFLARHPEIAHELADCLDGLDFVRAAGTHGVDNREGGGDAPGTTHQTPLTTHESAEPPLGDYRIVREIGQGGMGVVYEAVQLSLNRRVALKVLPFAAALDSRQLQRFKNEAHAAAQLHHTNIVPVYGVGSDRGIHYYAMQFIDGQTLAQVIEQLKQSESLVRSPLSVAKKRGRESEEVPATDHGPRTTDHVQVKALSTNSIRDREFFRTVANLGTQGAEALEHAHQAGVIHRDIKPANLLIEHSPLAPNPASLRLWITDFGLAHCQTQAGLTMTGDLVGTLRYMSPEQALAKRVLVDHRTDVYSLGATLYEALTLEPVFAGADRQELLRQIAFEEPRPPHRLNPAIPRELETIVLKALEKNPAERYATAQEMADDLTRFLKDQPIRARRPTLLGRLRKLVRRHPGVAATAALALVLVLVLTAIGLVYNNRTIRREQEQTKKANKRLENNLKLSLKALEETSQMLEVRLVRDPEEAKENEELLTKALGFYVKFAERNRDDPSVRREVVKAYLAASGLHHSLGQYDQSEAKLDRAADVASRLLTDFPTDVGAKGLLAAVHGQRGYLLNARQGAGPAPQDEYRKAIALLESLGDDAGQDERTTLADQHNTLAWNLKNSANLKEAEEQATQAVKLRRRLVEETDELSRRLAFMNSLANDQNTLACVLLTAGRLDEAEDQYRGQIRLLTQVDAQAGKLPAYRRGRLPKFNDTVYFGLGVAHYNLGVLLRSRGRSRAAAKEMNQAVDLLGRTRLDWPRDISFQRELAAMQTELGLLWFERGKRAEAGDLYGKAIKSLREVNSQAPEAEENQVGLLGVLVRMGDLLYDEGTPEKAAPYYREVQGLLEKRAARSAKAAPCVKELALFLVACADQRFHKPARAVPLAEKAVGLAPEDPDCLNTLGLAQYRAGRWQAAIDTLNKAKQLRRHPDESDWLFLAMAHWKLGDKKSARACYDRAVDLLKRYEWPPQEGSRWQAEAAALLGITRKPKTAEK
jgi:serine/threonine protein kinase/Flp pilus assembly protein TadD